MFSLSLWNKTADQVYPTQHHHNYCQNNENRKNMSVYFCQYHRLCLNREASLDSFVCWVLCNNSSKIVCGCQVMLAMSDERTDFSIMLSKHFCSLDASFSSIGCMTQSVRSPVNYSSDNIALKFHVRAFFYISRCHFICSPS